MREISVTVCSIMDGLAEHITERGIYTVHEGYAYGWKMTNASYILDEGMDVVLFLYYDRMNYYRDISVDRKAFDSSWHDDYEAYMYSMGCICAMLSLLRGKWTYGRFVIVDHSRYRIRYYRTDAGSVTDTCLRISDRYPSRRD